MFKKIYNFLLLIIPSLLMADMQTDFIGGNNFNVTTKTTFVSDLNDGSNGLETVMDFGLWFEPMPYKDRGIAPLKDRLSVALKLENSALFSWRGYTVSPGDNFAMPQYVTVGSDQADSIYFNNIVARVIYGPYWIETTSISSEITVSHASMFSVFDSVMSNTTDSGKNPLPLPLFNTGNWYADGVQSVIGRDLLHAVNEPKNQEVPVGGLFSGGLDLEDFSISLSAGALTLDNEVNDNSWVFGADMDWKPDFDTLIKFNAMAAFNYEELSNDDSIVLNKNPIAAGLNYEYRIKLPNNTVLKPVIGGDIFYNQVGEELLWEIGGGVKLFTHGTSKSYSAFGQDSTVGLFASANINQDNQLNAIVSFNEDPATSKIQNLGMQVQVEFMNITAIDDEPFLIAAVGQLEYLVTEKIKAYIFEKYVPGDITNEDANYTYYMETKNFNSKVGLEIKPIDNFKIELNYERNDLISDIEDDITDDGLISLTFEIAL